MRGQSPESTTTEPSKSPSCSRQELTASAVPRRTYCSAIWVSPSTRGITWSRSWPTTVTMRESPASCAASMTQRTIGLPRTSWATLGLRDFMRVPAPAAKTIAADSMGPPYAVRPSSWRARLGARTFLAFRGKYSARMRPIVLCAPLLRQTRVAERGPNRSIPAHGANAPSTFSRPGIASPARAGTGTRSRPPRATPAGCPSWPSRCARDRRKRGLPRRSPS